MKLHLLSVILAQLLAVSSSATNGNPVVHDETFDVTYHGVHDQGVEVFLGIPYGQDTGGENRFKPPRTYIPERGSNFNADSKGPACPQPSGAPAKPLYLSNVTDISEDCLHLNVYRPLGTTCDDKLPVLIYIHGGSFFVGSKDELVLQPGGLILRSVGMDHPVIVVNINYRLGVFGFAKSDALKSEGSENAGLRDQYSAIEWVRDHIASFGGDPEHITILGQSSGGLAVGMQIMAYGGRKPLAFQQASCESQALEPGITGNFTQTAMSEVADAVECNTTDLQSAATVACLRNLTMKELLLASEGTYGQGPGSNIGDKWLPTVDGDFLPDAPSKLISSGRFAKVTTMIGWCEDDGSFFVGTPANESAVVDFFSAYLPGMTTANVNHLLSLYPVSDFDIDPSAPLHPQTYRAGRIIRDILFTCLPIHYGQAISEKGNNVYLWDQNQTMFAEILDFTHMPGLGVIHTSNFAFQFNNLSHYDVDDFPYHPNITDFVLAHRQSGSWASFANFGRPSSPRYDTLDGWEPAFAQKDEVDIYVIGGANEGLFAESGEQAGPVFGQQKLKERCAFLNSPEIIEQLQY